MSRAASQRAGRGEASGAEFDIRIAHPMSRRSPLRKPRKRAVLLLAARD
jgi:hypothetical protein